MTRLERAAILIAYVASAATSIALMCLAWSALS